MEQQMVRALKAMLSFMALATLACTHRMDPASFKEGNKGEGVQNRPLVSHKVPAAVRKQFSTDHPMVLRYYWYGYPELAEAVWADFDSARYTVDVPAEYYISEYILDSIPARTVYSKNGKKLSTHRKVKDER